MPQSPGRTTERSPVSWDISPFFPGLGGESRTGSVNSPTDEARACGKEQERGPRGGALQARQGSCDINVSVVTPGGQFSFVQAC